MFFEINHHLWRIMSRAKISHKDAHTYARFLMPVLVQFHEILKDYRIFILFLLINVLQKPMQRFVYSTKWSLKNYLILFMICTYIYWGCQIIPIESRDTAIKFNSNTFPPLPFLFLSAMAFLFLAKISSSFSVYVSRPSFPIGDFLFSGFHVQNKIVRTFHPPWTQK